MKRNKLSLVRETIRPLTHDDLSQVAGGAITDAVRSRPGSVTATVTVASPPCFPKPGTTSAITGGPLTGTITSGGRVSGVSNAF